MTLRTRFAPSPTGFLHLGGARTALFAWAFARRHAGQFILRIEDTDLERSTPEAVQAILEGMSWLGLEYDEGPYYQTRRMDRYRAVIADMLASGKAYRCYMSPAELDALRAEQMARGEKPRYDGRWRDSTNTPPLGVAPVVRFRNPDHGSVIWEDQVKGRIEIANGELDDLVIARADGSPTYNFCVVVDDLDMRISHVIRGDDHVNNTPRQINIIRALGGEVPVYAHVPTVLGEDGQKLSKRHGAVSVTEYAKQGYLPEAMVNFLARLGWAHKDDEIFTVDQLVDWFDLPDINPAPARFDLDKLLWVNREHMRRASAERLGELVTPFLEALGCDLSAGPSAAAVADLYRDRAPTLATLAEAAVYFYVRPTVDQALKMQHLTAQNRPVLAEIGNELRSVAWHRETISQCVKTVATRQGLKLPQVMMPLRVLVSGSTSTPALDAVLALLARDEAIARIDAGLGTA